MAQENLNNLIEKLAENPELWEMGHNQNYETRDIGLGWLYYGLTKTTKPKQVVVIGSWRGFVPIIIGQALQENGIGKLIFIDPSYVDDHWTQDVNEYFSQFGIGQSLGTHRPGSVGCNLQPGSQMHFLVFACRMK